MNIVYVVSTLARSGPTSQLFNIILNIDKSKFIPTVITLSSEPCDSMKSMFEEKGVKVISLSLSRFGGVFFAASMLKKILQQTQPSIVHTQGFRADCLLARLKLNVPWIMTAHNYPLDDYSMKFGWLRGKLMAYSHLLVMRKCYNVVACSKTISHLLANHDIDAKPIQNGVSIAINREKLTTSKLPCLESPVFISVGSLIPRKNMALIVEAFNTYSMKHSGSLVVLGGGPEQRYLESLAKSDKIHIKGQVNNVTEFLEVSDYFVSSSLSEGLPMAVLEGFALGVPALLSDIPSHKEIESESPACAATFALDGGVDALVEKMISVNSTFVKNDSNSAAIDLVKTVFSSKLMSSKYQALYIDVLTCKRELL